MYKTLGRTVICRLGLWSLDGIRTRTEKQYNYKRYNEIPCEPKCQALPIVGICEPKELHEFFMLHRVYLSSP